MPGSHRHAFTYSIPAPLQVMVGQAVWVPFGARKTTGIVVGLTDHSPVESTRDIIGTISNSPFISGERIHLAYWISRHYIAPLFTSLALMLPPGFERNIKIKPKIIRYLALNKDPAEIMQDIAALKKRRSLNQSHVLEILLSTEGRLPTAEVMRRAGCGRAAIKPLIERGVITEQSESVTRDPLSRHELPLELPFKFTDSQMAVWQPLKASINAAALSGKTEVFLLHGVTGSGKTEIYMEALAESVRLGKKGICLVPEIVLTSQVVNRFFSRFPGRVAILHSKLTAGEQYDEWQRIRAGEFDVVIGPRSAIFAPQPDLGLIIVDEEHEWAYKQTEKVPRYHARDVAVELARLTGSILILGSATPDVASYYYAEQKQYQLIELKDRVTPLGTPSLPKVSIINMSQEYRNGNHSIFSRLLRAEMTATLEKHEQAILFVNRRGMATFVQCGNCGYIPVCRLCTGTLTYHASNHRLVCHHCRRTYPDISLCPVCQGRDIRHFGIGTESVEAECHKIFPSAATIRLDSDTVTHARDYEKAINTFRTRKADILIGTQIVAKGLDFPGVSLVGIINADTSLNLPDFRSGERTFQLICQVAGRAGRGIVAGRAIVQTFNPEYYAIKYAAKYDYDGFYHIEIQHRKQFGYPPFNDIVRLVYANPSKEKCAVESSRMQRLLEADIASIGIGNMKVIGPSPAFISRLRGKYQMQIMLLGHELQTLLERINFPRGWIVDVDPVSVL